MSDLEKKRWQNEQDSFCKTFVIGLIIITFYLIFIGAFGGMPWFTNLILDPPVFLLTDIFASFGFAVVSWEQYKKRVRKQEGKQL